MLANFDPNNSSIDVNQFTVINFFTMAAGISSRIKRETERNTRRNTKKIVAIKNLIIATKVAFANFC